MLMAFAETDVSICPSWFYHTEEDGQMKSVKELWDIYCKSVGRNSVLLLNLPPDCRGLLHSKDSLHIVSLRKAINETFEANLLRDARISSLHPRGGEFKAANLTDDSSATYYASKDNAVKDEITFTLSKPTTFDCLMFYEVIQLGYRTTGWSVEYSPDGKTWMPIIEATSKQSIGNKWIERFKPVTAKKVRLKITDGKACPALHTFGIYKQSSLIED